MASPARLSTSAGRVGFGGGQGLRPPRAIRDLIKQQRMAEVMLFRFDETKIPGLFSGDGSVKIGERAPREIADLILQRYALNTGQLPQRQDPGKQPPQQPVCYPFQRIHDANEVFGIEESMEHFFPTLQEHDDGAVHRSAFLPVVAECLRRQGWAWLRGQGAIGKTVLAAQLALEHEKQGSPAYYFDLAALDSKVRVTSTEIFGVVTAVADTNVLFVVDNVHLDARLASDLYKHWRDNGRGSSWLMLGRLRELGVDPRGVARPLDHLKSSALELKNTKDDLLGVYRRLVRRRASAVGDPPAEVLSRWHELFASGRADDAAEILRNESADREWLIDLLTINALVYSASHLKRLVRLGVRTARELDEILVPNVPRLVEAAPAITQMLKLAASPRISSPSGSGTRKSFAYSTIQNCSTASAVSYRNRIAIAA